MTSAMPASGSSSRSGPAPRDGQPRLTAQDGAPLVVFFPTEKETFLGFLIQGPYRTTPARDNVPGDDPENQALVRETAVLLTGVLRDLRASGLLTVEVLAALPLDAGHFPPGSMLRPLFDAVRTALTEEELIPAAGGGFAAARNLKLASSAELGELLDPGQLGRAVPGGRTARLRPASRGRRPGSPAASLPARGDRRR